MSKYASLLSMVDEIKKTWSFPLGEKHCTLIRVNALYRRIGKKMHKVYGDVSIHGKDLVRQSQIEKASISQDDFQYFWDHRAYVPLHIPLLPDFVFYMFPGDVDSRGYFRYVQEHIIYSTGQIQWSHNKRKFNQRCVDHHAGAFFLVRLT